MNAKESLIEAGLRLFSKNGYEGTSVRDIVEEAAVNVSAVSYHFGGKEELYKECIRSRGLSNQDFMKRVLTASTSREEFQTKFKMFIAGHLENLMSHPDFFRIMTREQERNSEIYKSVLSEVFLKNFEIIQSFFEDGIQRNIVSDKVNPTELAVAIQGALGQQLRINDIRKDTGRPTADQPEVQAQIAEQYCHIFLNGILA